MISSRIQVGFSTNTGKRRKNNQDAFLAENGVYMVFDGMGGGMGGERASKLAVDRFTQLSLRPFRTTHDISLTLNDAQHTVLSLGEELKGVSGTTATGIVIPSLLSATAGTRSDNGTQCAEPDLWYVVNIGDSRTYHMKTRLDAVPMAETLSQITKDHSERQKAIDSGTVPPQIANATIPRNIITQCIGSPNGIHPDFFAVNASGRFIVCSDGLHSEVSDSEIGAIAQAHIDPQQAADALTNAALDAGGHDNITVIVVDTGTNTTDWDASKLAPEEELDTLSDITLTGSHT
jgi:PPM family protein phosphatase